MCLIGGSAGISVGRRDVLQGHEAMTLRLKFELSSFSSKSGGKSETTKHETRI